MRVVVAEGLDWQTEEHYRTALVSSEKLGDQELRIDMLEVPSGHFVKPHIHKNRREMLTVVYSAGAQVRVGERIFRPVAGMSFEREAEDVLAITNDTKHPLRLLITRIGYDEDDIEWLADDEEAAQEGADSE